MAVLCELQFTADKKGRWKLIFVKAHLKYASLCRMRRHGVCNPHWRGSPMLSLCPLIHLQPGSPSSSIPPSLLLFVPPYTTPPSRITFGPAQCCSHRFDRPERHPGCGLSWRRTFQQVSLRDPDLLFILSSRTKLTHFGWVDTQRKCGWGGEGEAERQLKPEVALTRLGPRRCLLSTKRHFSQKRQQRLMTGLAGCFSLETWAVLDQNRE